MIQKQCKKLVNYKLISANGDTITIVCCRKTEAHQSVICILFSNDHMCRSYYNMFITESCRQQDVVIRNHENTDIYNTGQDEPLQKI